MFTRKVPLVAAFLCGILLLMAGVAPVGAQSETPHQATDEGGQAGIAAAPSQYLSYQGTLRDNSGNPDNGTHNMTVAIYDNAAASGTALFTQSFTGVIVRDGHFSLMLSSITPGIFSGADRFLKLTVDSTALTPTQRLAPVPYSVSANYANSLAAPDGDPLATVTVDNNGDLIISVDKKLEWASGTYADQKIDLWGSYYGIGVQSQTQYFRSDSNFAWFIDGTHNNYELNPGTGGTAAMVLHDGKLGVGTTGPDARVTVQIPDASTGWLSFKNSAGTTKWHANSYSDTGLNFAETGVADGRLFLEPGGNVGIGTTNPEAKLDVNGDIDWSGNLAGFTVTTYTAVSNGGGACALTTSNVGPSTPGVCFLTKVELEDIDSNAEQAKCEVITNGSTGYKQLQACADDDADAYCGMTCLSW